MSYHDIMKQAARVASTLFYSPENGGIKIKISSVMDHFDDPTFIDNVCTSYQHDFGLLPEEFKRVIRAECKEWMRAIKNNAPPATLKNVE